MKKSLSIVLSLIMLISVAAGLNVSAEAATPVSGVEIVKYAQQYEGYPYVWGTHGPNSFDCSGFVHYVYAHFGYDLPVSSSDYWNNPTKYGAVVGNSNIDAAMPGDVISWNGHVAIYIGNGKTVEALGRNYGVVNNYLLSNHSNKTYRVIRIYGVTADYGGGEDTVVDAPNIGWQRIDGKWYYYDADGNAKRFWNKIDGVWYYMNTYGEMQTGWKKLGGKWYYFKPSGAMVTYLQTIGGKKYYFNGAGAMQDGWIDFSDGRHYFLDGDGAMQLEWTTVNGKDYYLGKNGVMVKYLQNIESKDYYFYSNGIRFQGWLKIAGKWYYFAPDDNGAKKTGWFTEKGKTYYLDSKGAMVQYLKTIDGKKYYFYSNGARFSGWLKIKNEWYYFSPSDGAMVTGTQKIGSKTYTFDKNGVWQG